MQTLTTIRPELLSLSPEQIQLILPLITMFLGALVAILAAVGKTIQPKWSVFLVSLGTVLGSLVLSAQLLGRLLEDVSSVPSGGAGLFQTWVLFNGMMVVDPYSLFFNVLFLVSALVTLLASLRYLDREQLQHPEYYILVLFACLGMMLMSSSLDLIVLFVSLELMSLAVYILVGFRRADRRSNEAAMKYFILGSVASAVLLYGSALLYGATGSTSLGEIFRYAHAHPESLSPLFILGSVLLLLGFLFKVAAAPFHMWMPDVYEGSPVPVTGFMTTGLKAAAFATLLRVFIMMGYGKGLSNLFHDHIHQILWVCAVLTMLIGNLVALTQVNLKRILAYSSIAHTGYLLVGILAGAKSELGYAPVIFYILMYGLMNLGAFVVLTVIASRGENNLNFQDLSGFSQRQPALAFALAVFLFSMAGIPPTGGFVAKYFLFYSAVQADEIPLVVISVLSSAISVYYYLKVLVHMYLKEPVGSAPVVRVSMGSAFALVALVVLNLQLGMLPAAVFNLTKKVTVGLLS
ncbi:MAG: NADH-quinone oxidoreductase subunit N [Bdellovibrionia bacterium]